MTEKVRTCVVCDTEDAATRQNVNLKESQIDVIYQCDECGNLFTETYGEPVISATTE